MRTLAKLPLVLIALVMIGLPALTQAAHVKVSWDDLNSFRDVRAGNDNQKRFEKKLIAELEEEFAKVGASLPADQTLNIQVTDVDLAGYVEYFYRNYPTGLRVIRNIDAPGISLNYTLVDENGQVIKAGEEKLRDSGLYLSSFGLHSNWGISAFQFEKAMIHKWLRNEF